MNRLDFIQRKSARQKISMVTCYDAWSAQILAGSPVDCVLVGDSAAMVMHGHKTTLPATVELMRIHVEAVVRAIGEKFVIADLPFLSYRKSLSEAVTAVEILMRAGAHAVKLEGADGNLKLVEHLSASGIPVMGHLGLTPQAIHELGGFKVQGRESTAAQKILEDARNLESAGCFAVVLECIPASVAKTVSHTLTIPTIGIGAGPDCDGQVLVLHDLLGLNLGFRPRFLRRYMNGAEDILKALKNFDEDVKTGHFPSPEESYQ